MYRDVYYEIYPLGFCGALHGESRGIKHILTFIEHFERLKIDALYLAPIFQSDNHGYDTQDYFKIDERLGSNEDFKEVVSVLHDHGIKVIIDGVFNHVGRGFWAFQDVLNKRQDSAYKDWFYIDLARNNQYDDHLWYEGWENHFELVKLNLQNPQVKQHLFNAINYWHEEFKIDGLRLDVAYSLDQQFLKEMRQMTAAYPDFILIGELLHGDYNRIVNDEMLHSCTNYECYKGLYSSMNDLNLFEIAHSLNRQFGKENWCLYRGKHLLNFVDNHDVTRIASILKDPKHLPLVYTLLFTMPGMPCIYYGSEWGEKANKMVGSDDNLRPYFAKPQTNELCEHISKLAMIHKNEKALYDGDYENVHINNQYMAFKRQNADESIIVAINISMMSQTLKLGEGLATCLYHQTSYDLANLKLDPYAFVILKR
ncbi:MAG: alpha-amylase family glycosyl hydrolase [Erysipelotrichaceae bacterium]|nr:alpha-amylase family glycosyl hydrolase [Erysipelotrichaceae bacterium]MDY5252496.1 alpha-amylase family glycosyl hydrolase [Erysipelotrichaceae bacterium]